MVERFRHSTYMIRRKVLKLVGGAFHIYGPDGELLFYSKLKAFKLREDIRIYTDEDMGTEVLRINARQIIDFSATYDITYAPSEEYVGSLRRRGMRSMLKDEWAILNENEEEIGTVSEDNMLLALVRRFITSIIPQSYSVTVGGQEVATFTQQFNPFVFKLEVKFAPGSEEVLDRRLGLAAALLLTAVEGRQE